MKLKIQYKPIADLIPYARNSRTHSDAQIVQIASSIKEFGWTNPVLLDGKNGIIAGHGRVMAAHKLGETEVPTIELGHMDENQKRAYIIADNKLALNAGWDNEMLGLEVADLKDAGYDLGLTGFSLDELEALNPEVIEGLTDEDAVPEVPEEPITKLGDIYQLGNHRLMCGDSTSIDAVDKLMDGQKADMVFTDPPYGMFLNADYSDMGGKNSMTKKSGNKYDKVIGDHNDFTPELINTIFACFDYCKEIFMWGADYYAELLPNKNEGSWVVWDKRGDESLDKMYGSTFELCWSKAKHKRMMARVKWAGIFGMEKEHDKKRVHPTQKPVELVVWFFDYFSLKDKMNVVDLYGGSGSTLIASEKVGKKAFVMELDPKYCDVIVKRWEDFTGKQAELINANIPI
ncbi:DNA methylase N-4/N-6 [uncultured Caudovirales phage]|uniref:DNA methylase N-4/N-6 n=1 Tax=uncultured Caudovirales phage TaxID=2100421 RepID=A0A6J5KJQ5_9CAUD|nr:DNA methylase N-4/N-6 [uncultured Caudovirales phage]